MMDLKAVQEILRFVNKSDLTEVELEEGGFKLKIKRRDPLAGSAPTYDYALATPQPSFQPAPSAAQAFVDAAAAGENVPRATAEAPAAAAQSAAGANQHTIVSPMIGTFYQSASPDKEAYVKVGDMVRPGQTLCIIEAMKLFNEIESDVEGRVVKILVDNAQPVEYDQPLFVIELTK